MPNKEKILPARRIRGVSLSVASFFGCLLIAILFCYLAGNVCRGTGGRDIHSLGVVTGVLIGLSTIGLFLKRRVTAGQMITGLILIEVVLILLIGFFVGVYTIDEFTIMWFLGVNLYIGLPCLTGLVISSLYLKLRKKQNPQ